MSNTVQHSESFEYRFRAIYPFKSLILNLSIVQYSRSTAILNTETLFRGGTLKACQICKTTPSNLCTHRGCPVSSFREEAHFLPIETVCRILSAVQSQGPYNRRSSNPFGVASLFQDQHWPWKEFYIFDRNLGNGLPGESLFCKSF